MEKFEEKLSVFESSSVPESPLGVSISISCEFVLASPFIVIEGKKPLFKIEELFLAICILFS